MIPNSPGFQLFKGRPKGPPTQRVNNEVPSPGYADTDDTIWNQHYLAKAMLQMKDRDTWKLKFPAGCYMPYEHEKCLQAFNRSMDAYHPEIGVHWGTVTKASEETYNKYLKDIGTQRVRLKPEETLNRTVRNQN